MNSYFEYIGDTNKVIINDTSNHLMLSRVKKLSDCVKLSGGAAGGVIYSAYVETYKILDIQSDELIIAIRPKNNNDNISYAFQWHPCYSTECVIVVHNTVEKVFPNADEVYVYLYTLKPKSQDNFGLEIYDENSNKIFHSSNALLNVIDSNIIEEDVNVYGEGAVNHPKYSFQSGDKKIAIAMLAPWSNFEVQIYGFFDVAFIVYYFAIKWFLNGTIKFAPQTAVDVYTGFDDEAAVGAFGAFFSASPFSHFMLIDVTNIPVD